MALVWAKPGPALSPNVRNLTGQSELDAWHGNRILLTLCEGNPSVSDVFPHKGQVIVLFHNYFLPSGEHPNNVY